MVEAIYNARVILHVAFSKENLEGQKQVIDQWFVPVEWGAQIAAFRTLEQFDYAYLMSTYGQEVVDYFDDAYDGAGFIE